MTESTAIETLPLAPALAAWENEGGAFEHQESRRLILCHAVPEIVDALPPHLV